LIVSGRHTRRDTFRHDQNGQIEDRHGEG